MKGSIDDSTQPPPRRPKSPLGLLGRYRWLVLAGLACLLITNAMAQAIPLALKSAVESLLRISQGSGGSTELYWATGAILLLALVQTLFRILSRVLVFNAGRHAEYDVRRRLFGHLCSLDTAFYRGLHTGDLMSRLTNDLAAVRALLGAGALYTTNTLFAYAIALPLMLGIDVQLTLLALAPYPVLLLGARYFARGIYARSEAQQRAIAEMTSAVQEDFAGIRELKTYRLEDLRATSFSQRSADYLHHALRLASWRAGMLPFVASGVSASVVLVLWVGGSRVVEGKLTVGDLAAFNLYIGLLAWPTLAVGWMLSLWQRGLAAWHRIAQVLDAQPEIRGGQSTIAPAQGLALEVRDLHLTLGEKEVLRGVSFKVESGQLVGVVGRVGSGKSTLVDAIARMEHVDRGTIFFDGHDVTSLSVANARSMVAYAPQDAFLFSDTVGENISLGIPEPTTETLRNATITRAAAAAGLEDDLESLPQGMQTLVGERGITLSGGQRQRVALARALAAQRPLTILDDSLSAVDAETEAEILSHLREVLAGRSVLLVSHRLSALQHADQILVLDAGAIVERGTHTELMKAGGVYATLYERQLLEARVGEEPADG